MFLTSELGEELERLAARARRVLYLVAPFVKRAALERVLRRVGQGTTVTVITRWRPSEIAAGVSDPSILDVLVARGNYSVRLRDDLHAKVYCADTVSALVGSANLTGAGLGYAPDDNVEALVRLSPPPLRLAVFLRWLERNSQEATAGARKEVEDRAEVLRASIPELEEEVGSASPELRIHRAVDFFPNARNPGELFGHYCQLDEATAEKVPPGVIEDMACLSPPNGLDQRAFRQHVRERLCRNSWFRALDEYVASPRRFGELTSWLKERDALSKADHKFAQYRMQTIIRWLLHFYAERYSLTQPNYSEVLVRRPSASSMTL